MNMNLTKIENLYKHEINEKIFSLKQPDTEVFIVGGYLRDLILSPSCEIYDIDYVIKGESAINFARKTADSLNGYFVLLDDEHDIARVVLSDKKTTLDFARCVGENIETDLTSRDFTINSLAYQLNNENSCLIDTCESIKDIKKGLIRTYNSINLTDDPLRMFRAFRFSAQWNFEIEKETLNFIKENKSHIQKVSKERINAELIKMCEGNFTAKALIIMKETNFLDEIFPELSAQRKIPPNLHHHLWLLDHTIETVSQIDLNLKPMPAWAKEHILKEQATGIKYISLLKVAAIFHDIGKPEVWSIDEEGRHRFIKHEDIGAEKVKETLKELKFSKAAVKIISTLVKYHMYPTQILRNHATEEELNTANITSNEVFKLTTDKTILRFFRKLDELVPEVILLAIADRYSAQGVEITEEKVKTNINGLLWLLEKYKEAKEKIHISNLLSGTEIMEILNIPQGPLVGKIAKALRESQLLEEINSRDEALDFIKKYKDTL